MSAVTKARYRDAHLSAFRRVLAVWLSKLPPDGWEGDVSALEGALVWIARRDPVPAFVPRGTGLGRRISSERPFIQISGYRWSSTAPGTGAPSASPAPAVSHERPKAGRGRAGVRPGERSDGGSRRAGVRVRRQDKSTARASQHSTH